MHRNALTADSAGTSKFVSRARSLPGMLSLLELQPVEWNILLSLQRFLEQVASYAVLAIVYGCFEHTATQTHGNDVYQFSSASY